MFSFIEILKKTDWTRRKYFIFYCYLTKKICNFPSARTNNHCRAGMDRWIGVTRAFSNTNPFIANLFHAITFPFFYIIFIQRTLYQRIGKKNNDLEFLRPNPKGKLHLKCTKFFVSGLKNYETCLISCKKWEKEREELMKNNGPKNKHPFKCICIYENNEPLFLPNWKRYPVNYVQCSICGKKG